ncbi:MAG: DUF2207 domain-containing protein, partial [Chloroflexota bacterium]
MSGWLRPTQRFRTTGAWANLLGGAAITLSLLCSQAALPRAAEADEGWVINSFDAQIDIDDTGDLDIIETISVDFRGLSKHGIFRDIPMRYDYDAKHDRAYELEVRGVNNLQGGPHRFEATRSGSYFRIQIGDPQRTVTGRETYVIHYVVRGALNSQPNEDELYWNAMGQWPVATVHASATVRLPRPAAQRFACFQGTPGSTEPCAIEPAGDGAVFRTSRPLPEGQQFTVVAGIAKGVVAPPFPRLVDKQPGPQDFFLVTPPLLGASTMLGVLELFVLGWAWWTHGRDRHYTSVYYLSDDPSEETLPLLDNDPIVVEFDPPEGLRPGQMGLVLDERTDTLDATATIVDMAVRGYLKIVEETHQGLLGITSKAWRFERTAQEPAGLLPYEAKLLEGLFQAGDKVSIADLRQKYYTYLNRSGALLYEEAKLRKWFPDRPDRVRTFWAVMGFGIALVGGGVTFGLGAALGWGLLGLPVILGGLLLAAAANWMPRRTALGRELLRRTLGFRNYLAAAETHRQEFNERQNIFAAYLPYAMVFGCVDKWAKALQSLGQPPTETGWYVGSAPFMSPAFSNSMRSMASELSSAIVSTPGGSGGSGFSGGSAGGGGGGGGGGS